MADEETTEEQHAADDVAGMPTLDTARLNRLVELDRERRQLENRIKEINSERGRLEEKILDEMQHAGVQNMNIGGATVYLHRQLWARPRDGNKQAVIAALHEAGLDEYVSETFSTQSLSAYVRELDSYDEPLPPELEEVVQVDEVFKVRTRDS